MCRAASSPPPPAILLPTVPPSSLQVRPVWASNLASEIALIIDAVARHPVAAIDTEFPGVIYHSAIHPRLVSPAARYAALKFNVDALNIIQLGLTLSDASGNLHSPESIALLLANGIDLNEHRDYGIDSSDFASLIMGSGLVLPGEDHEVSWITFNGAYDIGFLIKMLTGCALPDTAAKFLSLVWMFLGPRVFDTKHVMQRFDGLYGGLDCVASLLKVKRAAGLPHPAGSDSLHTMMTFLKMKEVFSIGGEEEEEDAGLIFGLVDSRV